MCLNQVSQWYTDLVEEQLPLLMYELETRIKMPTIRCYRNCQYVYKGCYRNCQYVYTDLKY